MARRNRPRRRRRPSLKGKVFTRLRRVQPHDPSNYRIDQNPSSLSRTPPKTAVGYGWLCVLALVIAGLLVLAGWTDYSTHGNIVPARAIAHQYAEISRFMADVWGGDPDEDDPRLAEQELLISRAAHELVNQERMQHGLALVEYDAGLARIARNHSEDMAATFHFSHDNLQGEDPGMRARRQGYNCGIYDNIFEGQGLNYFTMSPEAVAEIAVQSWMGSSGHRRNILHPSHTIEGIGLAIVPGKSRRVYFTQNFC